MKGCWVPPDIRDPLVDCIQQWAPRSELPVVKWLTWIGLARSQYATWKTRYGTVNEQNAWIPRDVWLEDGEQQAIIDFYPVHPLEGYRRITWMMLDADLVAVSPASVYRVLKQAGLLQPWSRPPSNKGTGFHQPEAPHQHGHVDMAYLHVSGTCCFLCSVLDGCSRFLVHWEVRPQMTEADVDILLQRAHEACPQAHPRLISDQGPPFMAREFQDFIRLAGMTPVRTSPLYPQRNGNLERWHKSLKREAIRPTTPLSLEDAQRVVGSDVTHDNTIRLHRAIGYLTPTDPLEGRAALIGAERDRQLEAAREARKTRRAALLGTSQPEPTTPVARAACSPQEPLSP